MIARFPRVTSGRMVWQSSDGAATIKLVSYAGIGKYGRWVFRVWANNVLRYESEVLYRPTTKSDRGKGPIAKGLCFDLVKQLGYLI